MKTIIRSILALILFSGMAAAEETSLKGALQAATTDQNVQEQTTINGTVAAVDAKAMKLTIKGQDGENMVFAVSPGCRIRKSRRYVDLKAVVPGDVVSVTCGGPAEAQSITVQPGNAPAGEGTAVQSSTGSAASQ